MREGEKIFFAKALRGSQTDAERKMWCHLRGRCFHGLKFRRQYPMGPYIVDFICLEMKVTVELDGGHHQTQVEKDTKRTVFLSRDGFRIFRFWDHDVLLNMTGVLGSLSQELGLPVF